MTPEEYEAGQKRLLAYREYCAELKAQGQVGATWQSHASHHEPMHSHSTSEYVWAHEVLRCMNALTAWPAFHETKTHPWPAIMVLAGRFVEVPAAYA